MTTTQLFVELLVIGIGVAIWLAFLLAIVMRIPFSASMPDLNMAHVASLLGIAYVLGILVDRAAYSWFQPVQRYHRERVFGKNQDPSVDDRERHILVRSTSLREQILYNRSRLRICRSWILNFALIAAFSAIWAVQQHAWSAAPIPLIALALTCFTALTANTLARDHYNNIRYSYEFLLKQEGSGIGGKTTQDSSERG